MRGLLGVIKKEAIPKDSEIAKVIFATVVSTNPVAIRIDGIDTPIPSDLLVIGALCRRYVIPQPHIHYLPNNSTTKKETQEIELWRGLRAGDRVICFRLDGGQRFYIHQRYEMEGFRS